MGLSPRNQLIACLLLAGVGLALFFTGEYRDIPLPLGWLGTFLFVVAVWFCVDAVHRVPHSDEEADMLRAENLGKVFMGEHELARGMTRHVLARMGFKEPEQEAMRG